MVVTGFFVLWLFLSFLLCWYIGALFACVAHFLGYYQHGEAEDNCCGLHCCSHCCSLQWAESGEQKQVKQEGGQAAYGRQWILGGKIRVRKGNRMIVRECRVNIKLLKEMLALLLKLLHRTSLIWAIKRLRKRRTVSIWKTMKLGRENLE